MVPLHPVYLLDEPNPIRTVPPVKATKLSVASRTLFWPNVSVERPCVCIQIISIVTNVNI
jgi:hypothetical protein